MVVSFTSRRLLRWSKVRDQPAAAEKPDQKIKKVLYSYFVDDFAGTSGIKLNNNRASNWQIVAQMKLFSDFCDRIILYRQNYTRPVYHASSNFF